jgi:hypothetical protein
MQKTSQARGHLRRRGLGSAVQWRERVRERILRSGSDVRGAYSSKRQPECAGECEADEGRKLLGCTMIESADLLRCGREILQKMGVPRDTADDRERSRFGI